MTKNKTTKGNTIAKRIKMLQDKRLRYFMENTTSEFRLRVVEDKTHKQKKINPRNIEEFSEDEE